MGLRGGLTGSLVLWFVLSAQLAPAAPPTTSPDGAKAVNPALEQVTARLAEILSKQPQALISQDQSAAMNLVLRSGDVASARKLFDAANLGSDDLRFAGHLSTLLPGGVNGPQGREVLAKKRAKLQQLGTMEGLALGYFQSGNIPQALDEVRKLNSPHVMAQLLTIHPTQQMVDAYLKMSDSSIRHPDDLLRAYVILGQQDKADELIADIKASVAARQADRKAQVKVSSTDEPEPLIFRSLFFGALAKRDIAKAIAMEQERFDRETAAVAEAKDKRMAEHMAKQSRLDAYHAIAAAQALAGDLPGVLKAVEMVKGNYEAGVLNVPMAYAVARSKDAAAVGAAIAELGKVKLAPKLYAAALGAASAGRWAAGDADGAARFAQAGLAHLDTLKTDLEKAKAAFALLAGVHLGPEAILYTDDRYDTYPLQVPAR